MVLGTLKSPCLRQGIVIQTIAFGGSIGLSVEFSFEKKLEDKSSLIEVGLFLDDFILMEP